MGKITGFLEFTRELPKRRPVAERINDYKEFVERFPEEKLNEQAARCMDCGTPFCHEGCPVGNLIPEFNDAVYRKSYQEAYEILSDENSRKKYDMIYQNNNEHKNVYTYSTNWTPPADYVKYYSYDEIKNWYNKNTDIRGGMWDISEKENKGMWKTTLILFGSLGVVTLFILILSK